VSLRIGFDLDGVLADLDSTLADLCLQLFGVKPVAVSPRPAPDPPRPEETRGPDPETSSDRAVAPGSEVLTRDQLRRVWDTVRRTEDFWDTLSETEPGIVARLSAVAASRRWEVVFLTQRPSSRGETTQRQSQRWLARHGFEFPAVFVLGDSNSRGKVAAALGLDVVVDDRPGNCLDVKTESAARALLVWRDTTAAPPPNAESLGIEVVASVADCLDVLDAPGRPGVLGRLKKLLGAPDRD